QRLPVGEINGVTYYFAARIVDNNSALNANTAWRRDIDQPQPDPSVYGFFTSNIGLVELLKTPAEINTLNNWKWGASPLDLTQPIADPATQGQPGNPRNDFTFLSYGDALNNGLLSRLENPGFLPGNTSVRF